VILSDETVPLWLDPMTEDAITLQPIVAPYPGEPMDRYEVSSYVNFKNQGPKCIPWVSFRFAPVDRSTVEGLGTG